MGRARAVTGTNERTKFGIGRAMPLKVAGPKTPAIGAAAKIRILIADDHTISRSGLRSLLETQPDLSLWTRPRTPHFELHFRERIVVGIHQLVFRPALLRRQPVLCATALTSVSARTFPANLRCAETSTARAASSPSFVEILRHTLRESLGFFVVRSKTPRAVLLLTSPAFVGRKADLVQPRGSLNSAKRSLSSAERQRPLRRTGAA